MLDQVTLRALTQVNESGQEVVAVGAGLGSLQVRAGVVGDPDIATIPHPNLSTKVVLETITRDQTCWPWKCGATDTL